MTITHIGAHTFLVGDRVRLSPAWAEFESEFSLHVGDEGEVVAIVDDGSVAVRITNDVWMGALNYFSPMFLEHVSGPDEKKSGDDLRTQIVNLQYAAAADMVDAGDNLGHYILCQGQIEALDVVLEILDGLDV